MRAAGIVKIEIPPSASSSVPAQNAASIVMDTRNGKCQFASQVRGNVLESAHFAHSHLGMDLREAKALSLHITRTPAQCHRCHRPVALLPAGSWAREPGAGDTSSR
jgi:hypothetical protein